MDVFWTRGYEATSVGDLTRATGLSRSSLYQAFESKRGLFDRVLERYLDGLGEMLSPLEPGQPGLDGVLEFFDNWQRRLDHDDIDGTLGCLIVNTTAEMAGRDRLLFGVSEDYRRRILNGFIAALERAEARDEVTAGDPEQRARLLVSGIMGAFIASRGNSDHDDIAAWIGSVRAQAETWRR